MEWVSKYLNISNSRRFSRELEEVKCKSENETVKVLEYLENTDCTVSAIKPRLTPQLIAILAPKSTDSVPKQLKSNQMATASAADLGTEEAYLSDVGHERTEMLEKSSHPSSARMVVESFCGICAALLTCILFGYEMKM